MKNGRTGCCLQWAFLALLAGLVVLGQPAEAKDQTATIDYDVNSRSLQAEKKQLHHTTTDEGRISIQTGTMVTLTRLG